MKFSQLGDNRYPPDPEVIDLLDRAALEPVGLWVESTHPKELRQRMYELRRKNPNPDHEPFSILLPTEQPDQVWIVRKPAEGDEEPDDEPLA